MRLPVTGRILASLGGTALGVWTIKNVVSPVHRRVYRFTGGRVSLPGLAPVLLLTTTGRRSGLPRTIPVFYLTDGPVLVLCNVRPPGEAINPWVLNVRDDPAVRLELRGRDIAGLARDASAQEVERYWPRLERFFSTGGERHVIVVTPLAT